jgi:hypothetical protein
MLDLVLLLVVVQFKDAVYVTLTTLVIMCKHVLQVKLAQLVTLLVILLLKLVRAVMEVVIDLASVHVTIPVRLLLKLVHLQQKLVMHVIHLAMSL